MFSSVILWNVKCEIIFQLKTNIFPFKCVVFIDLVANKKNNEKKVFLFSMTLVKVDSVYWLIKLSILCVCWNWGSETKKKYILDKLQWFQVCVGFKTAEKKENNHKKINLKEIRSHYQNVFIQSRFFSFSSSSTTL